LALIAHLGFSHPGFYDESLFVIYSSYIGLLAILPLSIIMCIAGLLFIIASVFVGRKRGKAVIRFFGWVFIINTIVTFIEMGICDELRKPYLRRTAIVGEQLIDAIEKYENEVGDYPDSFNELTPRFVKNIPKTGMVKYPEFKYKKLPQENGGTYEISVITTSGFEYWTYLIYTPSMKYSINCLERFGNWAYCYES
jgi:energy-coupling factor transporter transmembrane protein EcfT